MKPFRVKRIVLQKAVRVDVGGGTAIKRANFWDTFVLRLCPPMQYHRAVPLPPLLGQCIVYDHMSIGRVALRWRGKGGQYHCGLCPRMTVPIFIIHHCLFKD